MVHRFRIPAVPFPFPPALLLAGLFLAALMFTTGCDQNAETEYEKAVEAQAELEETREEAAERVSEAEAEAIETVQEAREEAREDVVNTRQDAAEMVRDAEQKLQDRLDNLTDKAIEPAGEPAADQGVVVERKVIVAPADGAVEPSEPVDTAEPVVD